VISRRNLVLGSFAATLACRKPRGDGYAGYAFVANESGKAIAVVDLTAFAVAKHIRLPDAPSGVVASPDKPFIYALTPSTGVVHEISCENLAARRSVHVPASALSMRMSPDGKSIWVASGAARKLTRIDLKSFRVAGQIHLPEVPVDFDLSNYSDGAEERDIAVASHGAARRVSMIDVGAKRVVGVTRIDGDAATVRFRSDGKSVLVANTSARVLTVLDSPTGRVIVHLPLSIRPDNFCFKPDGGQLFITGEGRDAVVIVYPYYVPEVGETVLAGSMPGAMAATDSHLFVTNPAAGDLSILSILRRKLVAVTAVGADPGTVTITPDNEYALVLNRGSGDMAVIRIAGLQPDRRKSAALFTMIPVGSNPVGAVVKAV
jgi:DNA-binding beta-propeller fold protein YncE